MSEKRIISGVQGIELAIRVVDEKRRTNITAQTNGVNVVLVDILNELNQWRDKVFAEEATEVIRVSQEEEALTKENTRKLRLFSQIVSAMDQRTLECPGCHRKEFTRTVTFDCPRCRTKYSFTEDHQEPSFEED